MVNTKMQGFKQLVEPAETVAVPGLDYDLWKPLASAALVRARLGISRELIAKRMNRTGPAVRELELGLIRSAGADEVYAYQEALKAEIAGNIYRLRQGLDELEGGAL